MKLYERLRELRTERGMIQLDVATLSDISTAYISDLERGRTNPSLETLQVLATAFGITVNDVLAGTDLVKGGTASFLPRALAELQADPVLGRELTPDWVAALARIDFKGKRPRTSGEYYEIFTHLRRILAPEEAGR